MPEFITDHRDFCQRQIEFLAEGETEISDFCLCSLNVNGTACMRRRRPRTRRSRSRSCRRTKRGKSDDPDDPDCISWRGASS
jgi:hypothetical protein